MVRAHPLSVRPASAVLSFFFLSTSCVDEPRAARGDDDDESKGEEE